MTAYSKTTWVDDDGSGTVGTAVAAATMNNIENSVEQLDSGLLLPRFVIAERQGRMFGGGGAFNYMLGTGASNGQMQVSGGGPDNTMPGVIPAAFPIDPADFTLSGTPGKTAMLRIRGACFTNATSPGQNMTFRLYSVTNAGAANAMTFTVGSLIASCGPMTNPGASSFVQGVGTGVAVPAAGRYILTFVPNAAVAANTVIHCVARVEQYYT